ncbi:exonuclease SbcCD subunit D [Salibacterium salarium]|uniref:Exonuclease SbcCD subunit D n=1 Tax=Salibacterium salarium TaxID=284579 RepID=A0A428N7K3_9BACI|nr:exonuclease SbcCD subunit D [Salibacterium salarium]RSL34362.1 exonuclease SbcCD subunit D [Salibacterium salarium]
MEPLRFIHAADLHLGSTIPAAAGAPSLLKQQLEDSIYTAVDNMVKDAIQLEVDFIIIAGDLFDQDNRSLRNQLYLKTQFQTLQKHDIPVYVIFGNHDPVHKKYAPAGWPENVHIFDTTPEMKIFHKKGEEAAFIYGCSYEKRTLHQNIAKQYNKKEGTEAPLQIGLLHGQERRNTDHAYAPFDKEDLLEKEFDYWALGHIHTRHSLANHICYPGNIQARHRNEPGDKGYLYVHLDEEKVDVSFRSASVIPFIKMETSIDGHLSFDSLTNQILEDISAYQIVNRIGVWLDITLKGKGSLSLHLQEEKELQEWKEALNEIGAVDSPFFHIYRLTNQTIPDDMTIHSNGENHFLGDMTKAALHLKDNPEQVENEWKELMQHPAARTYLSASEVEDPAAIIDEAQRLLWEMWGKEKTNED